MIWKWFWLFFGLTVFCIVSSFIKVPGAHGQDVYSSLLPSTVTRINIGYQRFGSILQINPVSRNVRPFDTVISQSGGGRIFRSGKHKKHPRDVICNKLNFFHVDIH
jgi:hypothetical protein